MPCKHLCGDGEPVGVGGFAARRRAEELLRVMRRQTNGEVSETMHGRGIDYPLNYGVSVAEIRRAAAKYADDDELARELYARAERESRIAATYIANPQNITLADAGFWAAGITNSEIAGHVALLVGRSPGAQVIIEQWLGRDDELLQYTAVMAAARAMQGGGAAPGLDIERLLPLLKPGSVLNDRAIAAFIGRAWRNFPPLRPLLNNFITQIATGYPRLLNELDMERDLHPQ